MIFGLIVSGGFIGRISTSLASFINCTTSGMVTSGNTSADFIGYCISSNITFDTINSSSIINATYYVAGLIGYAISTKVVDSNSVNSNQGLQGIFGASILAFGATSINLTITNATSNATFDLLQHH